MRQASQLIASQFRNSETTKRFWGDVLYNVELYGAEPNGTDATAFINNAYDDLYNNGGGLLVFPYGDYTVTGPVGEGNNIEQLLVHSQYGSIYNVLEGRKSAPNPKNNQPLLWVQKFTQQDTEGDPFAHRVGGGYFEVYMKGTGNTANVTENTWIGVSSNVVQDGTNQGTATSQKWDARGNVIGIFGSARANGYPGNGNIITALWGYAATPELDNSTFDNLPANETFSTVGLEINLKQRHKDPGARDVVYGHGNTIGLYNFNYREANAGVLDWTFGEVYAGTPNTGEYANNNVDEWNGFHTGILLDKIKKRGVLFGRYMKSTSYGIEFPDNYSGMAQRPLAGIFMGDTVLNWGTYYGANSINGDMWRNGTALYYKKGTAVTEGMFSEGVGTSSSYTADRKITVTIGGVKLHLLASTTL